jgi:dihydroorotase
VLCSNHVPHDEESKSVEFDRADFGMISLQSFCANLTALSKNIGWDVLIDKVTTGPRQVLKMQVPRIEENAKANLTLIDPARKWVLNEQTNLSKSKNSPWFGKELTGKAVAVFNNGKVWLDA